MTKSFDGVLRGYRAKPAAMKKDPTYPIFELGMEAGSKQAIRKILDELEARVMAAPERFTPEYNALLAVARDMGKVAREFKPEVS